MLCSQCTALQRLHGTHTVVVLQKQRSSTIMIIRIELRIFYQGVTSSNASMRSLVVRYSMCSLVVSVLDSPAVGPRSNPGSGSALLMSEKSQAVYYMSSCHMLIDKALSSDKPCNGHWFEAD